MILSSKEVAKYSSDVRRRVDRIWNEVRKITDWDLFDGKVFQLDQLHENYLTGVFNDYRYFFAQNKHPDLKKELDITLVGVTGVLQSGAFYLLGKRSQKVTQFPGMWEFPPSGGISIDFLEGGKIQYEKQLFEELSQEVGMEWDFITAIHPFALIWDKEDQTLDLCARLFVDPIGRATASYQSPEYSAYEWLLKDRIDPFLQGKEVVPITHEIIKLL